MHKKLRTYSAYAFLWMSLSAACVDSFDGSIAQVDFGPFLPAQVRPGGTPIPGIQLPSTTHYRLSGVIEGDTPMLVELQSFEVHAIVELGSPCLIDTAGTRFPGIHLTQFASRMVADTGIIDIRNPPPGASEEDQIDVATAMQRVGSLVALGRPPLTAGADDPGALKAVVGAGASPPYPPFAAACVEDDSSVSPDLMPQPRCNGDESNRTRLRLCTAYWNDNPNAYEGSDRVLTQPLNGRYFGTVPGLIPSTGASVGGAQFLIEGGIRQYSSFVISIHDDATGASIRQLLLGRPSSPARGVTRVQMANFDIPDPGLRAALSSQMVIFESVGNDEVHF